MAFHDQAIGEYSARYASHAEAAVRLGQLLTDLLDEARINYLSVHGRAKDVDSFAKKARRTTSDGSPKYSDPLTQIEDQVGVRVITYLTEEVDATCDVVKDTFEVLEETDKGAQTAERGVLGYASKHFIVRLSGPRSSMAEYASAKDLKFEIQVRTTLQHAWAEFEHDVRYKFEIPDKARPSFDRRFALAAGLIELADKEFTEINDAFQELLQESVDTSATSSLKPTPLGPDELARLLASRYPNAPRSKAAHYEWMCGILGGLGVGSIEELETSLKSVDSDAIQTAMGHPYPAGAVRQLDDDLLAAFQSDYLELPANQARRADLTRRLAEVPDNLK